MSITRNEWDSLAEAQAALREFPFCRQCKSGLKLNQIRGHWITTCVKNPHHHGQGNWNGREDIQPNKEESGIAS